MPPAAAGPRRAWVLAAGLLLAVALPALDPGGPDGFPFSTYPMFTRERGRVADLPSVVAVDAGGDRHRLPPEVVAGDDEVLIAAAAVRRAVAGGAPAADRLCRDAARRLGDRFGSGVTVAVVTERVDTVAWLEGRRRPLAVTEHARCPAGGRR